MKKAFALLLLVALASTIVGLGLQIYVVCWKSQPFDIQTFGIGVGVLFTGVGAALALRPETKLPGTQVDVTAEKGTRVDVSTS